MEFFLIFAIGLIFGSFLNVVIYRLNPALQLKGGVFGRSICPGCKTQLKWRDLAPLLSFVYLCGRCRYCKKKISWQYPAVELLSGFLWLAIFYKYKLDGNFQFSIFNFQLIFNFQFLNLLNPLNLLNLLNFFYYIFIFSAFLIIAVYDFRWKIIPDKVVFPAIAAALIFNFFKYLNIETFKLLNFEIFKYLNIEIFILPLFIASIAFLFFFAIFYFSKGRAMGFGDAKLAFLIGLFLSPLLAIIAFVSAFIIGAISGIILMAISKISHSLVYKRWGIKSQIAFGPFLVLGAFVSFFFSDFIIKFFIF